MTIEQKRERLRNLKDLPPPISPALEAELVALVADLHAVEATNVAAATQRMLREREAVEARRDALERSEARRAALLSRLEIALTEGRRERDEINDELASASSRGTLAAGE